MIHLKRKKKRKKVFQAAHIRWGREGGEKEVLIWVILNEKRGKAEKSFFLCCLISFQGCLSPTPKAGAAFFFSPRFALSPLFRLLSSPSSQNRWNDTFFKLVHAKKWQSAGKMLQNDVKNWVALRLRWWFRRNLPHTRCGLYAVNVLLGVTRNAAFLPRTFMPLTRWSASPARWDREVREMSEKEREKKEIKIMSGY